MYDNKLMTRIINKLKRIKEFYHDRFIYWCFDYEQREKSIGIQIKKHLCRRILRGRKLIGFYGECHMNVYTLLLCESKAFKKKYLSINSKEIEYLSIWHSKQVQKKSAWDKLDIFIYNPGIPKRKGVPALEDVLTWLPKKAKKIEVTNAVFKGYMPQHTENIFANERVFIWGDKNLNKSIADKEHIAEVVKKICSEDYYSQDFVREYYKKSIERMKRYEKKCTIKIADYIEKNGRTRVLYHSVTHPTFEVMIELTRRISKELNLNIDFGHIQKKCKFNNFDLSAHGEAVYPSIYKGLGIIESPNERLIFPGDHRNMAYSLDAYIQAYMKQGLDDETGIINNKEG